MYYTSVNWHTIHELPNVSYLDAKVDWQSSGIWRDGIRTCCRVWRVRPLTKRQYLTSWNWECFVYLHSGPMRFRLQSYCLRAENNNAISHHYTMKDVTCSVQSTPLFNLHNFRWCACCSIPQFSQPIAVCVLTCVYITGVCFSADDHCILAVSSMNQWKSESQMEPIVLVSIST